EIDQPKLANILEMNQRMPARHFWRVQHNCVSTGSSYGTTTFDRMASAIGCFQPGTFPWGHAHTKALSKVTADGKYLPSDPDLGIARGDTALGSGFLSPMAPEAMLSLACSPQAGNMVETYELNGNFL